MQRWLIQWMSSWNKWLVELWINEPVSFLQYYITNFFIYLTWFNNNKSLARPKNLSLLCLKLISLSFLKLQKSFFKKKNSFLYYVYGWSVLCLMCLYRSGEGIGSPGVGVTDDWVAMWIRRIQLGFPGKTSSALNH